MTALRFWREGLLVAAVIGLVLLWRAHDRAVADKARSELLYARADSTIKANAGKLARVDTLLVRDTVRVRETVTRLTTLRDTVLRHLTDTLLIREYVTRTDSAAHACTELSNDCAAFRTFALQRFAQDSIKLLVQPHVTTKPRFGFWPGVAAGALAAVAVIHFTR